MQHNLKELCQYRFEQAEQALNSSRRNLDIDLKTSLNRSYYAILYAAKALLAAIRDNSDYKDFYIVSKDEAKEQIENADFFLSKVLEYLKSNVGIFL